MTKVTINDNDVRDTEAMLKDFPGLKKSTLAREVALGRLRCYRRGRTTYFIGADLLEWIRGGAVKPSQIDIEEDEEESPGL